MKQKIFLFAMLLLVNGITFISCQNSNEEIESPTSETPRVEKYNITECPDSLDIHGLFSKYKAITRSIVTPPNYNDYDFSSPFLLNIEGKEDNIYIIPATETTNDADFIIGVGASKEIAYQLYFKKTATDKYTLYNELKEPLFSASYNKENGLAVVTSVYGNDVPTIPVSRVRGGWFTAVCSVAISAGCYGLSAIGAVPSGGASLGLAACSTMLCLALC